MKKLYMTGPQTTVFKEVDEPMLSNENQVKIKLKYCGVCMSEHYRWQMGESGDSLGHEPVGVVVELGNAVKGLAVGDRVSGLFAGNAEYVLADAKDVFKLSDNITDEEGILEPLACLISAVSKVKMHYIGERVAVVGCGYMGCGAISLLKKRGFYVVGVDINAASVQNALTYGADEAYLVKDLPAHYYYIPGSGLAFEGRPGGFPLVMEWGETNESLDTAIRMTGKCGQLAVGAYHTGEKRLVDMQMLNVKAIDCLSTHPRETELSREACRVAEQMMRDGIWNFKHVPTKVYPASRIDEAHVALETKFGHFLKAVVDFTRENFEPYIVE